MAYTFKMGINFYFGDINVLALPITTPHLFKRHTLFIPLMSFKSPWRNLPYILLLEFLEESHYSHQIGVIFAANLTLYLSIVQFHCKYPFALYDLFVAWLVMHSSSFMG